MGESRPYGSLQRRQVTLNHEPDARAINSVVFMPQAVSDASYPRPRKTGTEALRLWPQLAGRFTDSFQTALDCVVRLGILNEGTAVHARSGTFDCVPRRHEQPLPLHFVAP